MPYDILIVMNSMNNFKSKTKYIAKDTSFCNRLMIQHEHRECKEDRVEHKTCVTPR